MASAKNCSDMITRNGNERIFQPILKYWHKIVSEMELSFTYDFCVQQINELIPMS